MKKAGGAFAPPARLLTRTAQNCGSEPDVSGELQLAHADSVGAVERDASDLSSVGILDIVGRRAQDRSINRIITEGVRGWVRIRAGGTYPVRATHDPLVAVLRRWIHASASHIGPVIRCDTPRLHV